MAKRKFNTSKAQIADPTKRGGSERAMTAHRREYEKNTSEQEEVRAQDAAFGFPTPEPFDPRNSSR